MKKRLYFCCSSLLAVLMMVAISVNAAEDDLQAEDNSSVDVMPVDEAKVSVSDVLYYVAPTIIDDESNASFVGSGDYHYRFVLTNVVTGQPDANKPFALSNKQTKLPFVPDQKGVYQGVTDELGRTPVFLMETPQEAKSWELRGRVGEGPYGEQFQIMSPENEPLARIPYVLMSCELEPFVFGGVSDLNGYTNYVASNAPIHIWVLHAQGDTFEGLLDSEKTNVFLKEHCNQSSDLQP